MFSNLCLFLSINFLFVYSWCILYYMSYALSCMYLFNLLVYRIIARAALFTWVCLLYKVDILWSTLHYKPERSLSCLFAGSCLQRSCVLHWVTTLNETPKDLGMDTFILVLLCCCAYALVIFHFGCVFLWMIQVWAHYFLHFFHHSSLCAFRSRKPLFLSWLLDSPSYSIKLMVLHSLITVLHSLITTLQNCS